MLAGNSRGGLLVVYSLMAEPSLFAARFAHSPALWRDEGAVIHQSERFLASPPALDSFLYLSLGEQEQENERMTSAFKRAAALLQAKAPPSLMWRSDFTRASDHESNARHATPVGLRAFFARGGH